MSMQLKAIRRILGEVSREGGEVSKVGASQLINNAPPLPTFQPINMLLFETYLPIPAGVVPFQHASEFPTVHDTLT